ncbi:hypothetical protein EJ05DRAFT_474736 [Pseudovirgaria hyperparasitica]|uniref:Uncharacterized protein n=1 Tax=Pseudovirgaria hyperparasitica TaxID=470096 RepID=A0A6A6WDM5_9PEZI|nr:uncharacterized protein EJ05DRAFT_474736 [Pseudovirgaria hyperparasitica]KAF2759657.1 hypothetical protein EJ05DRAFT_474736 [Pseudovirgaria hyperparasitica]
MDFGATASSVLGLGAYWAAWDGGGCMAVDAMLLGLERCFGIMVTVFRRGQSENREERARPHVTFQKSGYTLTEDCRHGQYCGTQVTLRRERDTKGLSIDMQNILIIRPQAISS